MKLFMQNEPNFPNTQINLTPSITKDYMKNDVSAPPKNEPKTKPIKANSPNAQNDHNPIDNKRLHKKRAFPPKKNEPNFKPNFPQKNRGHTVALPKNTVGLIFNH